MHWLRHGPTRMHYSVVNCTRSHRLYGRYRQTVFSTFDGFGDHISEGVERAASRWNVTYYIVRLPPLAPLNLQIR